MKEFYSRFATIFYMLTENDKKRNTNDAAAFVVTLDNYFKEGGSKKIDLPDDRPALCLALVAIDPFLTEVLYD